MSLLFFHAALARRQTALGRHCASIFMLPGIVGGSLFVAIVALFLTAPAQAQSSTWNSGSGNWSLDSNWQPAVAPVSSPAASLIFSGSSSYTATNDIGAFTLGRLQFVNTAGTATIAGSPATNSLDFARSETLGLPGILLSGAGNATISAPITWNGSTSVVNSGSGTLLLSGSQTYATGSKITYSNSGTGTITLADAITYGSAGTTGGLVLNLINNNAAAGTFNLGNIGSLTNVTVNVGGTGTVKFTGSNGGDLLSATALLNVQSGGTFDFGGNSESFGAFSGAGTVRSTTGVTPSLAGYYVFSGKLTGAGGTLTVAGATHTLVLSGSASDYTGPTAVTAGRLIVSANAPNGAAGSLGSATSEVLVGNTSGTAAAALLIDTPGVNIARKIRLQTGNTGTGTIGGLNTSGTVTYSGTITLGTDSAAAKGLTVYSAAGGTVEFTDSLQRATLATGATDTLTVNGGGTVALKGANTFSGATAVNGGTLALDFSQNNGSKLSATAALTLSGGSLSVIGNGSASSAQTVNGLVLGAAAAPFGGAGRVSVASGAGQSAVLNLGAITRNAGATVDFITAGTAFITTTTANTTSGILGGYATFGSNDWAVNDGSGTVAALGAGSYTTAFGSALHTSLAANQVLPSGGATTATLRFTAASALTFNTTTPGSLVLQEGGVLMASTAGNVTIGGTGTRGALSSSTGDLVIHQQSTTGMLTINSVISGTTLTKSGPGALVLSATNTYTGSTVINGGSVSVTAAANLGAATADVTINGGTLILPSGTLGTLNAANRVITIGSAGATFNFTANQSIEGSGLAGTGTLTLAGTGALIFGSSSSSFNGDIVINNGTLRMNSSQLGSVASITVNNGGTYNVEDDATASFGIVTGGRFLVNGNGFGGNGAIRLSDQTPNAAGSGNDPKTTMPNEIVLQTTSRIQVENAALVGSVSQLIFSGFVSGPGSLVKTGNGILTLTSRSNTYAGDTRVENGTLSIDQGNDRLPTGTTVTLGAGTASGVLQLNGFTQTVAGLATSGTGAANAVIGGNATSTSLLEVNVASGTQTYSGRLGGTGTGNTGANNNLGFIKSGAGTLILEGDNTQAGPTIITQGTLALGHASALGHGGAVLTADFGTTVQTGATLDLNSMTNVQEVITLNGTGVGGGGALVNNGAAPASIGSGVASLSFLGAATDWSASSGVSLGVSSGGADASATAQLGLGAGSLVLTSGGSGFTLTNAVINVSGGTGASVGAVLGVTSASYTVNSGTTTYSTAPTVTLPNGATGVANLNSSGLVVSITVTSPGSGFAATPTATFSGGTTLVAGTDPKATGNNSNYTLVGLNVINPGTGFTSVPDITITGGTGATAVGADGHFILNGIAVNDSGSGCTSAPTATLSGGSGTATANLTEVKLASDSSIGGSGDLIINAVISGQHALTKVGAGTTTLAANNTYTGATTVSDGTLQVGVAGIGKTGGGSVTLNGAFAVLAGTGSVENTTSVILGMIKPGDNGGQETGTLHTQSLIFAPASGTTVAELQIVSASAFDTLHIAGDLTLNSSSNLLVSGSSYTAAVGDSFTLLDWSGVVSLNGFTTGSNFRTGSDADGNEGNLDLPDISGIGLWQISDMIDGGALTLTIVASVPEPTRGMLVLLGCASLLLRRRRQSA